MFLKLKESAVKAKKKITEKMISAQAAALCDKEKYGSRAGRNFLAVCAALGGATVPAFASGTGGTGGTGSDIAAAIKTGVANAYGAMKTIGVVVAACGIALSAFYLFTGGDKGMEKAKKTLLYTVLGCGILFLAVPIVNFMSGLFSGSSSGFESLTTG